MRQYSLRALFFGLILGSALGSTLSSFAAPQAESNCTIGMVKNEQGRSCEVPIPSGCTTAKIPGYDQPWADISKGGATKCEFNEQKTDWKTSIIGSCGPCKTDNCSAQFIVKFNCSSGNEFKAQPRKKH